MGMAMDMIRAPGRQDAATTGSINSKSSSLELSWPVDVHRHGYLPMGA